MAYGQPPAFEVEFINSQAEDLALAQSAACPSIYGGLEAPGKGGPYAEDLRGRPRDDARLAGFAPGGLREAGSKEAPFRASRTQDQTNPQSGAPQ
ncbi:hypothetical protein ACFVHR_14110 [Streptomyces sp. NPDC127168]|uniref:hypothetical protein n=1 Tax=unclassified Streptomyces TaxID=2593676 RepID=UPI00362FDD27